MSMESPREEGTKSTKFTLSASESPEKIAEGVSDAEGKANNDSQDNQDSQDSDDKVDSQTDENGEQEDSEEQFGDDDKQESFKDTLFKKKDVRKPRTQSFQSVLSTASLKSLKQQSTTAANGRNASIIGSSTNLNNTRNFQSFIQAPVLSSISSLKVVDDVEIGKQLPFHDKDAEMNQNELAIDENEDSGEYEDNEVLMQQQKLTLNALKKLSLSPVHINNSEDASVSKSISRKPSIKNNIRGKNTQPYQPAQADLSTFASLTRQPKNHRLNYLEKNTAGNEDDYPALSQAEKTPDKEGVSTVTVKVSDSNEPMVSKDKEEVSGSGGGPIIGPSQMFNTVIPPQAETEEKGKTQKLNGQVGSPPPVTPSNTLNSRKFSLKSHSSATPIQGRQKILKNELREPYGTQDGQASQPPIPNMMYNKKLQQIKGFRNPMYVPAVLRMSMNDGFIHDELQNSNPHDHQFSHSEGAFSSQSNVPHDKSISSHYLSVLQNSRLSGTHSSTDSVKSFESSSTMDSSPSYKHTNSIASSLFVARKNYDSILTSAPTKRHWIKDESVTKCGIEGCPKEFNFFERRHHCRKCGGIYCKEHTSHYLYINHKAQFTTGGRGTLSKVCDICIKEYNEFVQHEFGMVQDNKPSQQSHINHGTSARETGQTASSTASTGLPSASNMRTNLLSEREGTSRDNRNDQVVGSVPANWSWSSF